MPDIVAFDQRGEKLMRIALSQLATRRDFAERLRAHGVEAEAEGLSVPPAAADGPAAEDGPAAGS